MKKSSFIGVVALFTLLSACHGLGGGTYTTKWINQSDKSQTLEMTSPHLSILQRVHVTIFGSSPKGSYILRTANGSTEGKWTGNDGSLTLTPVDGAPLELKYKDAETLEDESGTVWRADPVVVSELQPVLREW